MGCFKLPLTLCHEIEVLIWKFWWGERGNQRKTHWVKWVDLCEPKSEGGMGFKELLLFNDSLLAKQTWRLLHNKNSLFYRIFKSKFFPNCSIMEAKEGRGGSYAWKSILHGREVIRQGAKWRVGNGESIKVWEDNWLPSLSHPRIQGPLTTEMQEARVSSLINPLTHQWKTTLISSAFILDECELIKHIQLSKTPANDALFWPFVQSGH